MLLQTSLLSKLLLQLLFLHAHITSLNVPDILLLAPASSSPTTHLKQEYFLLLMLVPFSQFLDWPDEGTLGCNLPHLLVPLLQLGANLLPDSCLFFRWHCVPDKEGKLLLLLFQPTCNPSSCHTPKSAASSGSGPQHSASPSFLLSRGWGRRPQEARSCSCSQSSRRSGVSPGSLQGASGKDASFFAMVAGLMLQLDCYDKS